MRKIENLGNEIQQRHTILFQESEIILTLRFWPPTQLWTMDVEYKTFAIYGVSVAVNVLHMESSNQPFGFIALDTSGQGLDPFRRNDFVEGRVELYLLEPADMEQVRGIEVPV